MAGGQCDRPAAHAPVREPIMDAALRSAAPDAVDADDELARAFPGCAFAHVVTVVSRSGLSVTMDILSAMNDLDAALDWLRLIRIGEKLEHRLRVTGLSPAQARLLVTRLSAMAGIERAVVEHQLLRQPAAARGTVKDVACAWGHDRGNPSQ